MGSGAHLGLALWTSSAGTGSLYYTDVKGYRIAAGAPRAADGDLPDLFREFEANCRGLGRRPLYFGLPASLLGILDSLDTKGPRGRWHAGDVPVFTLDRWRQPAASSTTVPASIRAQARRARKQGLTVRRLAGAPGPDDPTGPALHACLRSWVRANPLPPMSFVTTPYLFDPWPAEGVFIAERDSGDDGKVEGFLVASEAVFPGIWRVDAVGRAEDAPNGCAELLIAESFSFACERGYTQATLGLAPLARRSAIPPDSPTHWMDRLAEFVREAGVPGYSFAGLEAFKAKFAPEEWRPLYCVSGGGSLSVRDMRAIARAFAGGSLLGYAFRSFSWLLGRRSLSI